MVILLIVIFVLTLWTMPQKENAPTFARAFLILLATSH